MTVSVKGINEYSYPVSLSASGQPSGMVLTFAPPFKEPTPAYTSIVTINVGSSVPANDYSINIKGTGANGKEKSSRYLLTVKPLVKPIVEPPINPPNNSPVEPKIEFISPVSGDKVGLNVDNVEGTINGTLPDGRYMWILVNPHSAAGFWWPQSGGQILPYGGKWHASVVIGRDINNKGEEDIGKEFDIAAVSVSRAGDQIFVDWVDDGKATNKWDGIRLPEGTRIMSLVTVTRK